MKPPALVPRVRPLLQEACDIGARRGYKKALECIESDDSLSVEQISEIISEAVYDEILERFNLHESEDE